MEYVLILRWLHILGATILIGTGAGIAFFMLMSHRTNDPKLIAHTASTVVVADWIFTATAVITQPITGILLASELGWNLTEAWLLASIALYIFIGVCWLPVLWIQKRLGTLAASADEQGHALPQNYYKLFRIWLACGFPAFASILIILWLMIARPSFG